MPSVREGKDFMHMKTWNLQTLVRAAVIGAVYAAVTLLLAAISFQPFQIRISEALTLLPCLWPEASVGLFIGCFLSNLVGGYGVADIVVGSLTTLAAALLTRRLRDRPLVAALPPVLLNALSVGMVLHYTANAPLLATMLSIGAGQAVACYALGIPLLRLLKRRETWLQNGTKR